MKNLILIASITVLAFTLLGCEKEPIEQCYCVENTYETKLKTVWVNGRSVNWTEENLINTKKVYCQDEMDVTIENIRTEINCTRWAE